MCCGQKRSELRATGTPNYGALNLHYSGQPQVYVRGSATGNLYQFSSVQPVQPVDPRDAKFLLASRLFRLAR
jgi:hypothetical protein